ncbi:hypothetical protein like AT3G24255 [Hibiscus trionum]|uniref:Reverse transcriptase zinc-binding domain-containing protein n=1 Tax=Hibiscus trionum TaxID=183268 RepID=A0A9W7MTI5_HIBTR|nr:hypothetical protein like AT3G24255 [Hibiscus trionum]
MAILDRLPTTDRLQRMGLSVDGSCCLCADGQESRDHIFSACPYSKLVWQAMLDHCGFHRASLEWEAELAWLSANLRGKKMRVIVCKIFWCSFVYHIWEERNYRRFRDKKRDCNTLIHSIKETVNIRIQSIGHL